MRASIVTLRSMHSELVLTYHYVLLAEVLSKIGQSKEGFAAVTEGFEVLQRTQERFYEAELHRLKGELTLQQTGKAQRARSEEPGAKIETSPAPFTRNTSAEADAEACFLTAIAVAQHQQAKSLELHATISLARLWRQQALQQRAESTELGANSKEQEARSRLNEAYGRLSEVYNWFTEGFETKDLQEAKRLLEDLSQESM